MLKWLAGIVATIIAGTVIWWLTRVGGPLNPTPQQSPQAAESQRATLERQAPTAPEAISSQPPTEPQAIQPQQPTYNCYSNLPAPVLILTGFEHYFSDGKRWTRFLLTVSNKAAFPQDLFAPTPELPGCGQNQTTSRTWADIHAKDGHLLNRLCALSSLDRLWFALPAEQGLPDAYVVLADQRCNLSYASNLAEQSARFRDERFAEWVEGRRH